MHKEHNYTSTAQSPGRVLLCNFHMVPYFSLLFLRKSLIEGSSIQGKRKGVLKKLCRWRVKMNFFFNVQCKLLLFTWGGGVQLSRQMWFWVLTVCWPFWMKNAAHIKVCNAKVLYAFVVVYYLQKFSFTVLLCLLYSWQQHTVLWFCNFWVCNKYWWGEESSRVCFWAPN